MHVRKISAVARNGFDARTDYSVVMMCLSPTSSPDVGTGVSRLRWPAPRGPVPSLRPGPPSPLGWGRAATSPDIRSSGANALRLPIG
jgi:hypothetical protein